MGDDAPLTILFTDVEGSTDLRTRRGDAAAHAVLRAHEEVVRSCLAGHGGREVKALGDGFMIAFTSARRALACAVAIQQAVEEESWKSPDGGVRVRIGLNTGEVVEEGDDLYGQAVNAAARIAGRAKGGEILVAEVTRHLAGSGPEFTFKDGGRLRLKGFPERWRLYRLVWESKEAGASAAGNERTPYVGRDAERRELRRLLDRAIRGSGGLVMVGGEPGVGKTRLTEELVAEAARHDVEVFAGHSYEMAGAAPYIAFVEIFEAALARAPSPQAFRQALGEEAPEVARLIPKLRQLCPDIPPPLELPAEQERRLLFNSVREVVARTAQRRPLLLVLDDLHWSDDPTLLLVEHLAETLGEIPVLVVATYRDTEVHVGRPLAKTFEDLRRRHLAHWLALDRLPEGEVGQMLQAMSRQEPPASLVEGLYTETDGNPFFLEEVYKYLVEEGRLFDAEGRFRSDLVIGELDVPAGVRLVVGRRLQRLGDEAPRILGTAAVVGRAFSVELLEAMEDMDSDALLDAIEGAQRARLIVPAPDPSGEDRFIFSHELIRQTLLADLSLTRRRRLHARTADALERHYAASLDQQAATIAYHLQESGAPAGRTFEYLVRAGQWAMAGAAFEEALRHYEAARALEQVVDPNQRADMLFELGRARRSAGLWEAAIEAWRLSVDLYEEVGDVEGVGRVCGAASYMLLWASHFSESSEMAQRGIAALGDRVDPARGRLLGGSGMVMGFAGDYGAGAGMIDQELAIAAQLGDDALMGDGLLNQCLHRWAFMEHATAADSGLRAAELLRSAGDLFGVAGVYGFTVIDLTQLGRLDEAKRVNEELEPLCTRVGHEPALLQVHRSRDLMYDLWETADLERFDADGQADMDTCERVGFPWVNMSLGWMGLAAFLQGDWEGARERYVEGQRIEAAIPAGAMTGWNTSVLFECLAYRGERSEALALLDATADQTARPGQPNGWGWWARLFATVEGLTVLGEDRRAAELYPLVVEAIERTGSVCGSIYDGRLIQRAAGIAAMAGARYSESESHFGKALQQAENIPHRPEQAHTRRWLGQMLLERSGDGDREQAEQVLSRAVDDYERMGMPRHRDLTSILLGSL